MVYLSNSPSPYLAEPNRLADVIAAIQTMGSYRYYKLDFIGWSDRITGDESSANHWKKVFEEHPEFFRLDSKRQRASLVLRRQLPKRYDVDEGITVSKAHYEGLNDAGKARISRQPLAADQIEALIDVAINLHSRAAEQARDRRWLIPPLLAFIGALIGAVLSSLLKGC
jgi:hypothetical protein